MNHLLIVHSNRMEALFAQLRDALFGGEVDLFAQRWVIVPTKAMKAWIQLKLVEDPSIGIAAGIRFLFLEEAVHQLANLQGKHFPTPQELILRIELLLLHDPPEALRSYLKSERRCAALARQLAAHFSDYGLYGIPFAQGHWQAELWSKVFRSPWTTRAEELRRSTSNLHPNLSVHLFGFSHLPPLYHDFFARISEGVPFRYYLLSPCLHYWGDIQSDKERSRLERFHLRQGAKEEDVQRLDTMLREVNPLLANLGRLGRRSLAALEGETVQCYAIPEPPFTLLQQVQAEILLLHQPEGAAELDESIEVHRAPTALREVEVLYRRLLQLLDKHADDEHPLTPGDVLVMAPDITAYLPLIEAVFGRGEIPFQVQDVKHPPEGSVAEGVRLLFDLAKSRWEATSLLALFEHTPFQEAQRLTKEEVAQIRKWIREGGIRWGQTLSHRNEKLAEDYGSGEMLDGRASSTWRSGIGRLLDALLLSDSPLQIPLSDAPLLDRFLTLIQSLESDLVPLASNQKRLLADWVLYFECLVEAYFGSDESVGADLHRMGQMAPFFEGEEISFETASGLLLSALDQHATTLYGHRLDGVQFCSMLPMRAIPSRVICLLGLHEGAFPRTAVKEPFNELRHLPGGDPRPHRSDVDRYLFLEALLSARDHFLISYASVCPSDGQEQGPSPVVEELVAYLGRTDLCKEHPHFAFHKEAIVTERDYRRAVAVYGVEKESPHRFEPAAYRDELAEATEEVPLTIDLRDLRSTASDPCGYYLRLLGVGVDGVDEERPDEETFTLTALQRSQLSWEALHQPIDHLIEQARDGGVIPEGPFGEVVERDLRDRVEELHQTLRAHEVDPRDLMTWHFSNGYKQPTQLSEGVLGLPPVRIELEGQAVELVGELPCVAPQGILIRGKGDLPSVLKGWPLFLLYCAASQEGEGRMLFSGSKKGKERFFESAEEYLKSYLRYHFCCAEQLPFLRPEWVPLIVEGDIEKLQTAIDKVGSEAYVSPYLRWALRSGDLPSASSLCSRWRLALQGAFAPAISWGNE